MKNQIIRITALSLFACSAVLYSCNKESVDLSYNGKLDLNQLVLKQARDVWDGGECNITKTFTYDENKTQRNEVIDLNIALYQNRTANADASVEVLVDADSLAQAIAKAPNGGLYEKYEKVQILPDEYYFLSGDKMKLKAGSTLSEDASLTIYTEKLIDYIQNTLRKSATYVVPITVKNASGYELNKHVNTVMYFIKVNYVKPANEADYLPDGLGVPDDDKVTVDDEEYTLVWHDEFNGEGAPNPDMWTMEEGFQRNEEDQWYSSNNAVQKGDALVITAREERVKNPNYNPNASGGNAWKQTREYAEYTSACLVVKGDYAFRYGYMEVRAKIPVTQGCWPAIWSTGNWYEWPLGGEIDMLEFYKERIHANVCWGGDYRWSGTWDSQNYPITDFTSNDKKWADKYHIWTMVWDESFIRLYLDGKLLNETDLNNTWNKGAHGASDGGSINPYKNDFEGFGQRMMLNLAIGGNNGRPIECSFPQEYSVDYVRIYQK